MQLEAVGKPLKYRLRTGEELLLQPGCPVEVPDESALSLMSKAGNRVRVVALANRSNGDLTGHIVNWQSRLFWVEMRATVLEDLGHSVRCVHPLTNVECVIPRGWLQGRESR